MHKNNTSRKFFFWVVILCFMFLFATDAFAATVVTNTLTSDPNGYLEISWEQTGVTGTCSATISGNVITYKSKCDSAYSSTGTTITLTIKNTHTTAVEVTLGDGSIETLTANGGNLTYSQKSTSKYSEKSGSVTISAVNPVAATYTPTFLAPTNGSYTVDDSPISTAYTPSGDALNDTTVAYTLVASANEGYTFFGWVGSVGGFYGNSTTFSYTCGANETVKAVFAPIGHGTYYISGSPSMKYCFFDEAITAASNSSTKTIVVCGGGNVVHSDGSSTEFTIPAGVTLLLPYSDSDISIKSGTSQTNDFKHANVQFPENEDKSIKVTAESQMDPTLNVLHTLTIPQGTAVTVNGMSSNPGRIIVGGTIVGSQGTNVAIAEGLCYGAHSNLDVNGTLNLGDYSVLSAIGYVLTSEGTGKINATGTGAELYQPMVIHDWRGAKAASLFLDSDLNAKVPSIQSGEEQICPFFQWGTFNIQPELKLESGNLMYLYASLYDGSAYCSHPVLIGTAGNGLIQLGTDATLTTKYEDIIWGDSYTQGFPGRNSLTISGDATLGALTMNISISFLFKNYNVNIDTANYTLPISYAYSIELTNGDFTINNSMSLLPGAKLEVEETATLSVGVNSSNPIRFMVFDGLNQRLVHSIGSPPVESGYAENARAGSQSAKLYPTTGELQAATVNGNSMSADAELIINGTLILGANANFGGVIQTDGTGTIDATSGTAGTKPSTAVQAGVVGENTALTSESGIAGMSLHELNAQIVSVTGERLDVIRGYTYNASVYQSTQESYSFKYYASSANTKSVTLIGTATAASGETVAAEKDAHSLKETVYGAWCARSDENPVDHLCDICSARISDCVDTNGDLVCDYAGCNMKLARLASMNAYADSTTELVLKFQLHESLLNSEKTGFFADAETGTAVSAVIDFVLPEDSDRSYTTKFEDGLFVVMQPIASGEMTKPVTVSFQKGGQTVPIVTNVDGTCADFLSRTVTDYAAVLLGLGDADVEDPTLLARQKEFITALLTYGSYAQNYFTGKTGYKDLDGLESTQTSAGLASLTELEDIPETYQVSIGGTLTSINYTSQEAYLGAAIKLRVYFDKIDGYTFKVTIAGKTYDALAAEKDGKYFVEIRNIPAAYLNETYTITASDGSDAYTVSTSVMAYLNAAIAGNSNDANLINLAKATWIYNQAARTFFGLSEEVA